MPKISRRRCWRSFDWDGVVRFFNCFNFDLRSSFIVLLSCCLAVLSILCHRCVLHCLAFLIRTTVPLSDVHHSYADSYLTVHTRIWLIISHFARPRMIPVLSSFHFMRFEISGDLVVDLELDSSVSDIQEALSHVATLTVP